MARDLTGKAVGGYRLGEVIGKGKASTVYEAEQASSGRKVAVKVYLADLSKEKNNAGRLVGEVERATSVSHPHLVQVLDVGTIENKGKRHLYVAMERLQGETLAQRLAGRPGKALPLGEALQIAADVGAALQAIHRLGGKHRGVCSEAVFLATPTEIPAGTLDEPDEVVKLLGLGSAQVRAVDPAGAPPVGPEDDDVKALALLLQEMLGGPAAGAAGAEPLLPLRLRNREVPVHVDLAIRRALGQHGASGGFSSPAALVAAALGHDDLLPSVGVWSEDGTMPPLAGRSSVAMGWVAVGALALVCGAIGLWWDLRQPPAPHVADMARPAPDLAAAPDLAPPPADLGAAPDLAKAAPEVVAVKKQRPRRTGPPVPPVRGPADYDPDFVGRARPKAAPAPAAAPTPTAEPISPGEVKATTPQPARPKRPRRTGPPIPPLRSLRQ